MKVRRVRRYQSGNQNP